MTSEHQQSQHPNVHLAFSPWSEDQKLYVACMYSNPQQWTVRRELLNDFRKRMEASPNVVLYVGEVAFGNRPFEVTDPKNPRDIQFRTSNELWLKENVLNLIVSRFPPEARYVAYLDGDVQMSRYDWALEAIHQLQHYSVVQLFHQFTDMDYRHRPYCVSNGFGYSYSQSITPGIYLDQATAESPSMKQVAASVRALITPANYYGRMFPNAAFANAPSSVNNPAAKDTVWWGATGLGWAFRRSTWDAMGGLFDQCILGSADWVMAYGMVGLVDDLGVQGCAPYYQAIKDWQHQALSLKADIWYVDNHITHFWHGPKTHRFYRERERILVDNAFNPHTDLKRDWQGLWQLAGNKPKLRDDLRHYFRARNEEDPSLGQDGRLLA